ncbi:MAG: hypothetical protein IPM83_11965 [Ignavibacteria bacterium]|nr:hypothetical protein [Ignavibacteria bacterium]
MAVKREPKLIQLLRPLSPVQIERLLAFVRSPYYNTSEPLVQLLEVLAPYHPFPQIPSDEEIWGSLHPNEPFRYATLRNRYSDLVALAMRFLAVDQFQAKPDLMLEYQVAALRHLLLFSQVEKTVDDAFDDIERRIVRDDATLDLHWRMLEERSLYQTFNRPGTGRDILQDELNVLVELSIARMLRQITLMIHEQYQHGVDFDLHFSADIMEFLHRNPAFRKNACIDVYAAVVELSATPSPDAFVSLRTLIRQRIHELPFVDGYMAFTHLADHCMYQINVVGDDRYYKQALLNIQAQIELKYLGKPNLLYPDYIFLVRMAVGAGELNYAREFMAEFADALMPNVREDVQILCEAVIAQYEGRADDAVALLQKVTLSQPLFKLMVRIYTIENLMVLGRWDDVRTAVDALRHLGFPEGAISVRHYAVVDDVVKIVPRIATIIESEPGPRRATRVSAVNEAINGMTTNIFGVRNWLRAFITSA